MVQPAPLISEHHQHPYIQPGGLGTTPTPITPISHAGGLVTPSMQPGYNPQAVGVARPGSQGLYGAGPIGVSTPQSQPPNFSRTLGGAVVGLEVKLSGRHQGLCRYLARLLRPLWDENIVQYRPPSRTQPEEQVTRAEGGIIWSGWGCCHGEGRRREGGKGGGGVSDTCLQ